MKRQKLHFLGSPPESIQRLIRQQVRRLHLDHWTITVAWIEPEDLQGEEEEGRGLVTVGAMSPANEYRKAYCQLPTTLRANKEGADTIKHELLHCVQAPIGHAFYQWFMMEAQRYPKAFSQEAFDRWFRLASDAEDGVVEHLLDLID